MSVSFSEYFSFSVLSVLLLSFILSHSSPRSRIVGGSPAPPGSWPWLVNLQLDGGLMCGGVLVDSSWVVFDHYIFSPSHFSFSTSAAAVVSTTGQMTLMSSLITHQSDVLLFLQFNPKTFNNDIALVELTSPVVLSEHVTPVCLPSGMEPPTGSSCLVAGWGSLFEDGPSAEVVMEAKVPLLPQSTCKSALGKDLVTSTMLCAGYLSGAYWLFYFWCIFCQLYGITSWGDGCGEKGKPGVYTRVFSFSDWIQAEIQSEL
uniref:Peptidase S1 domain-containing protein n=1 Tax=Monopterus albus TaxID=43700 RepID=A0A3Q3JKL3_MONAL